VATRGARGANCSRLKLLVDMNLSPLWIEALEARSFEATHWSQVGDPRAPDRNILEWARREGYVVFTHDLDFARLLALTHAEGPSVIQLRSQSVLPDEAGTLVFTALQQHADLLEQGALVVIDAATSRARILPIK
jgi:predicted nuclease of predicted toxin-antitoxin system